MSLLLAACHILLCLWAIWSAFTLYDITRPGRLDSNWWTKIWVAVLYPLSAGLSIITTIAEVLAWVVLETPLLRPFNRESQAPIDSP